MLYTTKVTTTPGTPIPLGGQVRAGWVLIQWKITNSGNLYIGGPTSTRPFSSNAPAITAGNSELMPWIGSPGPYSLDKILVDSDNAGDVLVQYFKP